MMFNMCFREHSEESDDSDVDSDESGRPRFSSITKVSGFLDKELAASGFTRKDQDDIEKFNEGDLEKNLGSDGEGTVHKGHIPGAVHDSNIKHLDSVCLVEQDDHIVSCDDKGQVEEKNQQFAEAGVSNEVEIQVANEEEEDKDEEIDPELTKRLNKQRRRAIAAAHGGRKSCASRNSYKDKGGRSSSHNSKIQKQMSSW
ncbi:non-specific serine,threonine protein kinase [Sarracenia purpurea var. burkii]